MKIAFLHLTQGLVDRGAERAFDLLAVELTRRHTVAMIQAGPRQADKPYRTYRVTPMSRPPQVAPRNILEKVLFRLELDESARAVRAFTRAALPTLARLKPDYVIVGNGAPQLRLLKHDLPGVKTIIFGESGLGHHERAVLRAAPDLYVALTEAGAAWARPCLSGATHLTVIGNPIKLKRGRSRELGLPRPVILCVAALSAYKHVADIVKAADTVPASLLVIGDGEEQGQILSLLSQRAGDFRYLPHVDPADLPDYYASADVFAFVPDAREAFGNVYLEAMAAGLPIIAVDDAVRRELIGPTGSYVQTGDIQAIRTALMHVLALPRQDYRAQLAPFTPATVVRRLEKELYALS